jgi:sulfoxide reductase heme-binding subunit YedZ
MALLADTTAFWVTSRAAGIAALVCSSGAVAAGLLLGLKAVRGRAAGVRAVHEGLALATLAALALHAAVLLFDPWMQPSIADLLVPFAGEHAPFWTGLGIIAAWSMVALGLSYYARGRIGAARWRRLHRFTALAWLLSVGHALGAGTDAGTWWFLGSVAIVAIPALSLLIVRMSSERGTGPAPRPPVATPRREPVRPAGPPSVWGPPAR